MFCLMENVVVMQVVNNFATYNPLQNFAGHAGERYGTIVSSHLSPAWPAKFWRASNVIVKVFNFGYE